MLNWDTLVPSSTPDNNTLETGGVGQEKRDNTSDLHNKVAFVPVCPSENPPLSHLVGQPEPAPLLASGAFVPVVPVVPPVLQGVGSSGHENAAAGVGQEVKNLAPENEGASGSNPPSQAAVCLVAACEKAWKPSPEEIGRHTPKLHRLPPDLKSRIRAMGKRWDYADDELAQVLEAARHDPEGWMRVVVHDEQQAVEHDFLLAGAGLR